jgi:threonine aldolase
MMMIDLRSDTVTLPTPAMREAIAKAPVGDDVYGEDPTINQLQEVAASRLGKQAALFVPSGTMANQIAIRTHTQPGDALFAGRDSHVYLYEAGAAAAISGVQATLIGDDGFFGPAELAEAIFPHDSHFPNSRLVCVENTHNRSGGRIFPMKPQQEIASLARERGLSLHLDGARIFNAAVASATPVEELAAPYDSVAFCLSKGLGAPVGSLLCGSHEFIARAHRFRKMFGGGMRQAGLLAAAGLHALEHHVNRLAEDHENARALADAIVDISGVRVVREPETNMVIIEVSNASRFVEGLRERDVLVGALGPKTLRIVTHLDLSADDIPLLIERFREVAKVAS